MEFSLDPSSPVVSALVSEKESKNAQVLERFCTGKTLNPNKHRAGSALSPFGCLGAELSYSSRKFPLRVGEYSPIVFWG